MQKLKLQQKTVGRITYQQINFMKLLQVSSVDMPARILQEVEENPLLEQIEEENYLSKNDIKSLYFKHKASRNDDARDYYFKNLADLENFRFKLIRQLEYLNISDRDFMIGEYIIKSLDSNGYLRASAQDIVDEFAFTKYINLDVKKVETIIKQIQKFNPIGVGARSLQECLLIQLNRLQSEKYEETYLELAKKIVDHFFPQLASKRYKIICERLHLNYEDLKNAIDIIQQLNPKPVGNDDNYNTGANIICPDFIITKQDGKLLVSLSNNKTPSLKINSTYAKLLKGKTATCKNSETTDFLRKKINAAEWFINAIKQRGETMLNTMNAIVDMQPDFFETEDESNIKPLVLREIAQKIGMDTSTISRVVSSKYIQTNFGIYPLKFFFSEALSKISGGTVSSKKIKKLIKEIISKENKQSPYTDEKISDLLKQKGYKVARRTIAKYREQLDISIAYLRREI